MIKNKKGFTLIELIIVMAIIGILAVVAVIAIGSKAADARDARRLADMSTVRTAMALYCAEPVNAAGVEQSNTIIAFDQVTTDIGNLEICNVDSSDILYLNFDNLHDPAAPDTLCENTVFGGSEDSCDVGSLSAVCDYAFASSPSVRLNNNSSGVEACDYTIIFYQEGGDAEGYLSEEGIVE